MTDRQQIRLYTFVAKSPVMELSRVPTCSLMYCRLYASQHHLNAHYTILWSSSNQKFKQASAHSYNFTKLSFKSYFKCELNNETLPLRRTIYGWVKKARGPHIGQAWPRACRDLDYLNKFRNFNQCPFISPLCWGETKTESRVWLPQRIYNVPA